jgi:hypothetical protein
VGTTTGAVTGAVDPVVGSITGSVTRVTTPLVATVGSLVGTTIGAVTGAADPVVGSLGTTLGSVTSPVTGSIVNLGGTTTGAVRNIVAPAVVTVGTAVASSGSGFGGVGASSAVSMPADVADIDNMVSSALASGRLIQAADAFQPVEARNDEDTGRTCQKSTQSIVMGDMTTQAAVFICRNGSTPWQIGRPQFAATTGR